MNVRTLGMVGIGVLVAAGCQKKVFTPPENRPPETFVAIRSPITDTVPAKVGLAWYGNDPDGEVVGFHYIWLYGDSVVVGTTFTTATSDTFVLPVLGDVRTYTFRVWAEDNEGAVDPTPAEVSFPMVNSPPEVAFAFQSLPPETTLPAVTFFFEAHDVDGDTTITNLLFRLDTDTAWTSIPYASHYTLTGIPPGNRTVYFRVADFTGAVSDSIAFSWVVEPLAGTLLVILDHVTSRDGWTGLVENAGFGPGTYTVWEFPRHESRSVQDFPEIRESFEAILFSGFTRVLWASDEYDPALTSLELFTYPDAQGRRLFEAFLNQGGKILLSGQSALQDMASDFAQTHLGVDPYDTTQVVANRSVLKFYGAIQRTPGAPVALPDSLTLSPGVTILTQPDGFLTGGFTPLYQAHFLVNGQDSVLTAAIQKGNLILFSFELAKTNGLGNAPQVLQVLLP